jgi:ribonuclease J
MLKGMTSLTFYGGVDEIGGNKILLEDRDTRIFLDFGMSFSQSGKYFSEFLTPRKCNGVLDFIKTGLLPDIPGIYRLDYLKQMGRKRENRGIDAVLISHAHMDHVAYIHHLRRDIELIMSHGSHAILRSIEETGSTSWQNYLTYSPSFMIKEKKREEGYTKVTSQDCVLDRPVKALETGEKHCIDDVVITPLLVDHSLPGATSYLIRTSEGTILYTGDFRFHGYYGHLSEAMVETVCNVDIDAIIIEGTRINEKSSTYEKEVYHQALNLVADTAGMAIITFPPRDLTRLLTFTRIAEESGRKLVIGFKQANLLEHYSKISSDFPKVDNQNICLYAERKNWGTVGRNDIPSNIDGVCIPQNICYQDYATWERKYLDYPNTINYLDLKNHSEYIFFCSYFQLNELVDVEPVQGSKYIRSITEPFSDEMRLDAKRVVNWLKLFGLEFHGMENKDKLHASGHASGNEIFATLDRIKPKQVFPIHTENPDMFRKHCPQTTPIKKDLLYQI